MAPSFCLETGANCAKRAKEFLNEWQRTPRSRRSEGHVSNPNALFISALWDVTLISMLTPCATSRGGIFREWQIGREEGRKEERKYERGRLKGRVTLFSAYCSCETPFSCLPGTSYSAVRHPSLSRYENVRVAFSHAPPTTKRNISLWTLWQLC